MTEHFSSDKRIKIPPTTQNRRPIHPEMESEGNIAFRLCIEGEWDLGHVTEGQ